MATKKGSLSISSENIFPVIKKWLYSDHDIFYRELISNGCDAITKLKKLELMGEYEKPEDMEYKIQVTVNPTDKTIAVSDNGLGMTAGEVDAAVLPEPMVTIACAKNEALTVALDLTEQWDAVFPPDSLVLGCVVARTEFAEDEPELVDAFLEQYGASIQYLTDQPADAAALIEQTGVFTNAAVAEKAIPRCNVCFITGEQMRRDMEQYLTILFEAAPESIGGTLPDEDFYYIG